MAEPPPPISSDLTAPELPPHLAQTANMSTDELLAMLNSTPLFMTDLPTDDDAAAGPKEGENIELEAFKALVHEGSPGERAREWRERGNEVIVEGRALEKQRQTSSTAAVGAGAGAGAGPAARAKRGVQWVDAREYYSRALSALKEAAAAVAGREGVDADENEPVGAAERRAIEEACYVNRALCHLELQNYGSCTRDCAAALALNPRSVKALYRSAAACLALDKLAAAADACARALALDRDNAAAHSLDARIRARAGAVAKAAQAERERRARRAREADALARALRARGIVGRRTAAPPAEVEDALLRLEVAGDEASALVVPVLLLYPVHAQTDLVKGFREGETLAEHLAYILPVPWDEAGEYRDAAAVECFMDAREGGGMLKVGKKVALGKVLGGGKVELVDGLGRIYVVPKGRVASWVEEMKNRRGKLG